MTIRAGAGLFIVFEGGEGAGKTTQVKRLAENLSAVRSSGLARGDQPVPVTTTREPGGTALGQQLRDMLLNAGPIPARAEALLYAADRAAHAAWIRDALSDGHIVICDRYEDSSIAYQGAGRLTGESEVAWLSHWGTNGLHPDLTVLLDIDPKTGLTRAAGRDTSLDRMEREPLEFHTRVRNALLHLAEQNPVRGFLNTRYLILDATRSEDSLAAEIATAVEKLILDRNHDRTSI